MKKTLILMTVAAVLCTAGLAFAAQTKKPLIVYFSSTGNTRTVAKEIQKSTGGDLFEIQTVKPYPQDYTKRTEVAKKEQQDNARPALKVTKIPNLAKYDTVILGTPCWWGDLPMAAVTLLEANDLSSKSVAQFMTHGGSGLGSSEATVRRLCPKSKILKPVAILGSEAGNSQAEVDKWLKSDGIIK
jgi:flavodoxin